MKAPELEKLRRSGRISATARERCRTLIQPGARLEAIALEAERIILEMGGRPAFPAQLSRNHIAAHYCPAPGDPTEVQAGDIVKLDLGTHVDGYVTDTATTVDLANGPDSALVAASRVALENAISLMGPGASITEIGRTVEDTIKAFGFNPVYNLTGHGVARYTIHCAPSIPNYPDPRAGTLRPNMTIACEPFACDGKGHIECAGDAQVFGIKRGPLPKNLPADLAAAIEATEGLPFARRTLRRVLGNERRVEEVLVLLRKHKLLVDYQPLVERKGVRVAQTEHTIFIHEDHAEVLTRDPE
ncbi:MAG: type II methionyl aminopeptidase [Planctomycetes bacterium]|nr:type II methionyl aminopeptidase [Planctomycetota bacterium]